MILLLRVFGRSRANWILSGCAIGPIILRTWPLRIVARSSDATWPSRKHDVRVDALALDGVREAHDRRLGHRVVAHERALDLGGAHAVPAHVDDVVHAAEQPEVAVGVHARAVTGEVAAGEALEVHLAHARCGPGRPTCRASSPATAP